MSFNINNFFINTFLESHFCAQIASVRSNWYESFLFYYLDIIIKNHVMNINMLMQSKYSTIFPNLIIFFMLISIVAAFFVLWSKNPIYSLISLITVFFSVIIILLLLNVEFLSLIFLIIYIGAIAILFLFVIMMFNIKQLQSQEIPLWVGYNICFYSVFFPKMYYIIYREIYTLLSLSYVKNWGTFLSFQFQTTPLSVYYTSSSNDILVFGHLLYVFYGYLLMLTGVILLTAMVGSIILALSTLEEE